MSDGTLGAALRAHGIAPDAAVLTGPPTSDSPPPPEGVWAIVPTDDTYAVGSVGRGHFATYQTVASEAEAIDLVVRLLTERPRQMPADEVDALDERGAVTSAAIRRRGQQRGGASGTAMLGPGEAVDVIGPDTGHHLYALGTPFAQRSQPPTDAGRPYHRYLVLSALPEASEGVTAPWFGQPGGGAMVVLTRPIRWYVDQGHLVELV